VALASAAEVECGAAARGLAALVELIRRPVGRKAVAAFQTDLQAASEQITTLAELKRLHELMQQLEGHYNLIYHDGRWVQEEEERWDDVERLEPEIRGVVDDLIEVAARMPLLAGERVWIDKLTRAMMELREAADQHDIGVLKNATRRLNEVLNREPSRVNTRLIAAANTLRLPALVDALKTVLDGLAGLAHELQSVRQLEEFRLGVVALEQLNTSLMNRVINHGVLQGIDDELRRVEALLDQCLDEVGDAWPDLKGLTDQLQDGSGARWREKMQTLGVELENALLTKDPAKIKRQFRSYRSQASRSFNQVDRELLDLCEKLQRVGKPLADLLRLLENG
jgi:hypothetical protein